VGSQNVIHSNLITSHVGRDRKQTKSVSLLYLLFCYSVLFINMCISLFSVSLTAYHNK